MTSSDSVRALLFLLPLGLACGPEAEDTGLVCESEVDTLPLVDTNNYTFDGTLSIESATTVNGDIAIDFGDVMVDLQGHVLDPVADIDAVNLINFRYLSQAEVEEGLAANSLNQSDISLFVNWDTGGATSLQLSDLGLLGNDIDIEQYYDLKYGGTWMLTINTGTVPGVGARMVLFLEPGAGSASAVSMSDSDTVLSYTVDIESLVPAAVPAATPPVLDWSALTIDSRGGDIGTYAIDQVLVGYYADATAAELEGDFLDLELNADAQWHFPVEGGTSLDLASTTATEGAFPGIDASGIWILALRCTTCANPAPPFLTTLSVCEPG